VSSFCWEPDRRELGPKEIQKRNEALLSILRLLQ
jgi:hypothetical protein